MKHTRKKSNGTKRHGLLLPVFLVAVVALIFTVPTASAGHRHEKVELDDATIIVEVNATDGDAGFQIFLDGEGWRRVSIYDPNWRQIFKVKTRGGIREIGGGTELFLETAEPEFETPDELQELLDLLPEGKYRFFGRTVEGAWLYGKAKLTHNIPCKPELLVPAEVDPEDGAVPDVVNEPVNISWEPVDSHLGADSEDPDEVGCTDDEQATIEGYQVIVEGEDGEFDITLPDDATNVDIPDQFTDPETAYKFEVLAIEESGNQTIVESFFCTTGLEGEACREAALDLL